MTKLQKDFRVSKKEQKKKIADAIVLLNDVVSVRLAPSSIQGIGVFSLRDLKKGKQLNLDAIPHAFDIPYKELKKLNPEVREVILAHWPNIINGSHFLYPVTKMTAFLNHSNNPSYDAKKDTLLRDLKKGEELTEDYRVIENWQKVFPWLVPIAD